LLRRHGYSRVELLLLLNLLFLQALAKACLDLGLLFFLALELLLHFLLLELLLLEQSLFLL